MIAKEFVEERITKQQDIVTKSILIDMLQDFARLKCKERREKDKQFILPLCKKLITKVDTGKARSKETYKDMKDIINFLNSPEPEI